MGDNNEDDIFHENDTKEFCLLGQGNTAEIYQYQDSKILKLFRDSMPFTAIRNEYRIARIIQDKLKNVPRVCGLVTYRSRYGIVYEQITGEEMIQLFLKNILYIRRNSRLFAKTHVFVHQEDIDVHYSVKEKLFNDINSADELTFEEKEKIIEHLHGLPDKNRLCHFDFHPGNIILQNDGPIVIDWMTACTGDPSADVARTVLLMRMGEMMHINPVLRVIIHIAMKKIGREYRKEYKRQTGISDEDVDQWMLPVAAARLSEWLTEHERKKLISIVRKELTRKCFPPL